LPIAFRALKIVAAFAEGVHMSAANHVPIAALIWLAMGMAAFCQTSIAPASAGAPAPASDGVLSAEAFPGSDIGARINAATAACPSPPAGCTITVQRSGIISTPPRLPSGTTLIFNPTGTYTLATNWVIAHRGITVNFSGAPVIYPMDDGTTAIYVGKNIASTIDIDASHTTITWRAGQKFLDVDVGDQLQLYLGDRLYAANVANVNSSTSITLTGALHGIGGGAVPNVPATFYLEPDLALGTYAGHGVVLNDLNIVGTASETNAADTALRLELVSGATVRGLTVSRLGAGDCLSLRGALSNDIYDVRCYVDGSGITLDRNVLGGFTVTGSNANRIIGVDLEASNYPLGCALCFSNNSSSNVMYGVHVEGNNNRNIAVVQNSTGNAINIIDWERNVATAGSDLQILSSNNTVVFGPAQIQSYVSSTGIEVKASTQVRIQDLAISGGYTMAVNSLDGSSGTLINVSHNAGAAFRTAGFSNIVYPHVELAGTTPKIGDFPLSPGCHNQPTVKVAGAAIDMVCAMSGAGGVQPANVQPQCFVSAADTVVPQLCAAVATTPAAQNYNIRVIQ
jgi:hypothetical protein